MENTTLEVLGLYNLLQAHREAMIHPARPTERRNRSSGKWKADHQGCLIGHSHVENWRAFPLSKEGIPHPRQRAGRSGQLRRNACAFAVYMDHSTARDKYKLHLFKSGMTWHCLFIHMYFVFPIKDCKFLKYRCSLYFLVFSTLKAHSACSLP